MVSYRLLELEQEKLELEQEKIALQSTIADKDQELNDRLPDLQQVAESERARLSAVQADFEKASRDAESLKAERDAANALVGNLRNGLANAQNDANNHQAALDNERANIGKLQQRLDQEIQRATSRDLLHGQENNLNEEHASAIEALRSKIRQLEDAASIVQNESHQKETQLQDRITDLQAACDMASRKFNSALETANAAEDALAAFQQGQGHGSNSHE